MVEKPHEFAKRVLFHPSVHQESKRSFIEAEQDSVGRGVDHAGGEPNIRWGFFHYVNVSIFITGTFLIVSSATTIGVLSYYWMFVVAGGFVGLVVVGTGFVITWSGRGLSNTVFIQGYVILAIISFVSLISQVAIIALLIVLIVTSIPPSVQSHGEGAMWAWVQFLSGTQAALAVLVSGMVGGSVVLTSCCQKTPRDNVIGVYHPR